MVPDAESTTVPIQIETAFGEKDIAFAESIQTSLEAMFSAVALAINTLAPHV